MRGASTSKAFSSGLPGDEIFEYSRWSQMAVSQDIITENLMGGKPYDIDFEALNVHR